MPARPTDILGEEHRLIEKVITATGILHARLGRDEPVAPDILQNLGEFFRVFVDRYHQAKEESCLWPALRENGLSPQECPLADVVAGHKRSCDLFAEYAGRSRAYIETRGAAKQPLAVILRDLAAGYSGLLWEEDHLLFPIANKILRASDQQNLLKRFASMDMERGRPWCRGFEHLAAEIQRPTERSF
ncbi:MAG: hemerythrin domain-containing protein [Terriglobia bacterium]